MPRAGGCLWGRGRGRVGRGGSPGAQWQGKKGRSRARQVEGFGPCTGARSKRGRLLSPFLRPPRTPTGPMAKARTPVREASSCNVMKHLNRDSRITRMLQRHILMLDLSRARERAPHRMLACSRTACSNRPDTWPPALAKPGVWGEGGGVKHRIRLEWHHDERGGDVSSALSPRR